MDGLKYRSFFSLRIASYFTLSFKSQRSGRQVNKGRKSTRHRRGSRAPYISQSMILQPAYEPPFAVSCTPHRCSTPPFCFQGCLCFRRSGKFIQLYSFPPTCGSVTEKLDHHDCLAFSVLCESFSVQIRKVKLPSQKMREKLHKKIRKSGKYLTVSAEQPPPPLPPSHAWTRYHILGKSSYL